MKRIFIIAIAACSFMISSCEHKAEEAEAESEFIVTSPEQIDTVIYQEYVGQIHSANHIELRSQEKGYLEKIFVDEGEFVQKGQLMFKIMPNLYEAEVEKAKV